MFFELFPDTHGANYENRKRLVEYLINGNFLGGAVCIEANFSYGSGTSSLMDVVDELTGYDFLENLLYRSFDAKILLNSSEGERFLKNPLLCESEIAALVAYSHCLADVWSVEPYPPYAATGFSSDLLEENLNYQRIVREPLQFRNLIEVRNHYQISNPKITFICGKAHHEHLYGLAGKDEKESQKEIERALNLIESGEFSRFTKNQKPDNAHNIEEIFIDYMH